MLGYTSTMTVFMFSAKHKENNIEKVVAYDKENDRLELLDEVCGPESAIFRSKDKAKKIKRRTIRYWKYIEDEESLDYALRLITFRNVID